MYLQANQLTQTLLTTIDHLYLSENKNVNMKHYFQLLCGYGANNTKLRKIQKIWTILYRFVDFLIWKINKEQWSTSQSDRGISFSRII